MYLAGPMTGFPDFNYPKFHELADKIREHGFIVRNPAESFNGDQAQSRATYAVHDAELVATCDAVAVMDGWENSAGSRFETHEAALIGIPVIDADILALSGVVVGIPVDKHGGPLPSGVPVTPPGWWDTKRNNKREERVKNTPFSMSLVPGTSEILGISPQVGTTNANGTSFKAVNLVDEDGDITPLVFRERVKSKVHDYLGEVDGGGYKSSMDNPEKLPLWLIPNALGQAAARALQHGAAKYAPNNWRRGMPYSEVYSALQRHLTAWLEGENYDGESSLNHLDHAAACLSFLCEYTAQPHYAKFDDRFKRNTPRVPTPPSLPFSSIGTVECAS